MKKSGGVKSFKQQVNGINFYCELRGSGPSIVLIPSGEGDCGSFSKVADALADEFTVFTLDMRGCSRTGRPPTWTPMTAKNLASDVAGLIKVLNLAPASIYGCSSGGQTVLSIGVYYPEVARNLIVHEAALQNDTSLPGSGLKEMGEAVAKLIEIKGSKNEAFLYFLRPMVGDDEALQALGPEYLERIKKNGDVFFDLIFRSADQRSYTAEELAKMPPLVFSIGLSSTGPLVESNLNTARRAKAEVVKLPGMHFPQITHPDAIAKHIREQTKKHL